jgi:DNA repair exonuclease SbcCD ATPase subunit
MIEFIYHISDLHIFKPTIESILFSWKQLLDIIDPENSIIVITGDIFEHKNWLYSVDMDCFASLAESALRKKIKIVMIIGNHDHNSYIEDEKNMCMTLSRISKYTNVTLFNKSDKYSYENIDFYVYSDDPKISVPEFVKSDNVPIALVHETIQGAILYNGFTEDKCRFGVESFKQYAITCLGDIHKPQFLAPNIAYAGSFVQKNKAEGAIHGFIKWNVYPSEDSDDDTSWATKLESRYGKFYPLKLLKCHGNLKLKGEEFNISMIKPFTSVSLEMLDKCPEIDRAKIKHDIELEGITVEFHDSYKYLTRGREMDDKIYDIKNVQDQIKIITQILQTSGTEQTIIDAVIECHKIHMKDTPCILRKQWKLKWLKWSNLYLYGENNYISFDELHGVNIVIGDNKIGKSQIFDILFLGIYGDTIRGNKGSIVNQSRSTGYVSCCIEYENDTYICEREFKQGSDKHKIQRFTKNGTIITGVDVRESYSDFAEFITSKDLFKEINFATQIRTSVTDLKPTERINCLSKYLELDLFDSYCEEINTKKLGCHRDLTKLQCPSESQTALNDQITKKKDEIEKNTEKMREQREQTEKLEKECEILIRNLVTSSLKEDEINAQIVCCNKIIEQLKSAAEVDFSQLDKLKEEIGKMKSTLEYKNFGDEYENLRAQKKLIEAKLTEVQQTELILKRDRLLSQQSERISCHTKLQEIDEASYHTKLQEIDKKMAIARASHNTSFYDEKYAFLTSQRKDIKGCISMSKKECLKVLKDDYCSFDIEQLCKQIQKCDITAPMEVVALDITITKESLETEIAMIEKSMKPEIHIADLSQSDLEFDEQCAQCMHNKRILEIQKNTYEQNMIENQQKHIILDQLMAKLTTYKHMLYITTQNEIFRQNSEIQKKIDYYKQLKFAEDQLTLIKNAEIDRMKEQIQIEKARHIEEIKSFEEEKRKLEECLSYLLVSKQIQQVTTEIDEYDKQTKMLEDIQSKMTNVEAREMMKIREIIDENQRKIIQMENRKILDKTLIDLQKLNKQLEISRQYKIDIEKIDIIHFQQKQIKDVIDNLLNIEKLLSEQLRKLNAKLAQRKEYDDTYKEHEILKAYHKCLDKKTGISSFVLKRSLDDLQEKINKYLIELTDFAIEFKTDSSQLTMFLIERSNIIASPLASGFQKFVIDLIFRLTVLETSNLSKILFVDEGFGCLDASNVININEFLKFVSKKMDFIFIVTHMEVLKSAADLCLPIKRENGISEFRFSTNHEVITYEPFIQSYERSDIDVTVLSKAGDQEITASTAAKKTISHETVRTAKRAQKLKSDRVGIIYSDDGMLYRCSYCHAPDDWHPIKGLTKHISTMTHHKYAP